jgi:hypothetical protein
MTRSSRSMFRHRPLRDGTFDSICTWCFMTVGNRTNEAELQADEESHACSGFFLGAVLLPGEQRRAALHGFSVAA